MSMLCKEESLVDTLSFQIKAIFDCWQKTVELLFIPCKIVTYFSIDEVFTVKFCFYIYTLQNN